VSVRWGLLGAGWIARQAIAPAIHAAQGSRLEAVGARDSDRARSLEPTGYAATDYARVIGDANIDAIYIALDNAGHEPWVIAALAEFNVKGEIRPGRVGVWVTRPERPPGPDGAPAEEKIAAIGVRLRRWVSFHGLSINVDPDLEHFSGIVPCGIRQHGVTSLQLTARRVPHANATGRRLRIIPKMPKYLSTTCLRAPTEENCTCARPEACDQTRR